MEFVIKRQHRLAELRRKRPEFSEVFDFYNSLYAFLAANPPDFLRVAHADEFGGLSQREGFPLLQAESLQIAPDRARAFLSDLIEVLQRHGHQGQDELTRVADGLAGGDLDPAPLFGAYLERDRKRLAEAAAGLQTEPAIVEYLTGLALSFALHQAREKGLRPVASDWPHGFCPLCGGTPVMGELVGDEGRMLLHCGTCGESWPTVRRSCASCGNSDGKTLEYFTAGDEKGYRVNVCRRCDSYLKVIDSREEGAGQPMDLEDVSTLHLDLLAQREGFTRGKRDYARETAGASAGH